MGLLPFERIDMTPIVRASVEPNVLGVYPNERPIKELLDFGVVNLDKPAGPTSHQVSAYVQKALHIEKSGHSGTLDPGVTGILAVSLGRGTRVSQSLLTAGKEYVCLMKIHEEKSREEVEKVLKEFTGKIRQLPPVKSAVKRQWRNRNVYYNELLDHEGSEVLFRVGCQAGTYIRKLCHDMGEAFGCGAHMAELRRTKAGPFKEDETLVTLHDLADAYAFWKENGDEIYLRKCIQPLEVAVAHLPTVTLLDSTVHSITQGATLKVKGIASVSSNIQASELVAMKTLKGELVAVGEALMISKDMATKDRGVAVKSTQVFMPVGTYPKM